MLIHGNDTEKATALSSAKQDHDSAQHKHHYIARTRERVRQFLHPDGRRIHIASSPEEVLHLRETLSETQQDQRFDILLSGTPEHLEALREAQMHHETRLTEFQEQHGDVYRLFASTHADLDALSSELDRVTKHGVSLEAHFSKYGYDARIRTHDDDSGSNTPRSNSSTDKSQSEAERGFATTLKLFKYPTMRQYFHKGIIWRASGSEEVQSFELFVDLLYVGIIAIIGDLASEEATGTTLLHFIITFTLSWNIWNDMVLIISWFETDDIFQRLSIIFLLICLFGFTVNINEAFEITYPTLIGFYLAARLFMACYLVLVAILVPMMRAILIYHTCVTVAAAALWIASIHVEWPNQLALIWVAMFIDVSGHSFYVILMSMSKSMKRLLERIFEFYPAINIEHRTERMNAFVTLIFGYTVVAILYQSTVNGIDDFFGKAAMGLIQAFVYNWIYFEIDSANLSSHAIRRHKVSAFVWSVAHLPFIMAFTLAGAALSRLVVAHDTRNSRLDSLTTEYEDRSAAELEPGLRWFYCAGMGIALALMGMIASSHVHKEAPGLRLKKRWRLAARFCVAITLICLPLAENLNSLNLIGVVTALIVFVLIAELWASSCCTEKLFQRSKPCQYVGRCGKKEMDALVSQGKEVRLGNLSRTEDAEGGVVFGR